MSWLPRLFEGPEICARISESGAAATGLAAGTPVAAGAGDQGAGAVGMGIVAPGSVSATIGTSGVVFAATDQPTMDRLGRLHTFCHAVPGMWHVMGVTNGAGLSLRWLRDTFAPGVALRRVDRRGRTKSPPPAMECSGRRTSSASARRISTPRRAPHSSASPPRTPAPTSSAPSWRASPSACATRFPCSPNWEFPWHESGSAEAARAARSGGRFRPTSTATRWSCSPPRRAARSARRCWPASAWARGPAWRRPAPQTVHVAQTIQPKNAAAMDAAYARFRRVYPALREIGRT